MLPHPKEGLGSLGAYVRAARLSLGINQARAAREAGVSRRQLTILEKGGNVSVLFLLKVARYLNLTTLPLDGTVELASTNGGASFVQLLGVVDEIGALVDRAKMLAVEAVLPPSERRPLSDTQALTAFVNRHVDGDGLAKLADAVLDVDRDAAAIAKPVDSRRVASGTSVVARRRTKR